MRITVICSGGLDSVTLGHKVFAEGTLTRSVSFDYGQRHKQALDYTRDCAVRRGVPHDVVPVIAVGRFLTGSALTGGSPDPEGHCSEDTMQVTAVPDRIAIVLAVAFGKAAFRVSEPPRTWAEYRP